MATIEYFFDPTCPWTWATSRWLVDAASQRDADIEWRNLSLGVLNRGKDIPEQNRARLHAAALLHRVIAAAHAAGDNAAIGELYTEWGRQFFHDGAAPTEELVRKVVGASSATNYAEAIDEEAWDCVVEASTDEAMSLAGPDVGSPILAFGEPRAGIFGPLVSPPPAGESAAALYDLVMAMATTPGFFELKRGRCASADPGPRP
jgi:hypothetical protein